MKIFIDNGHGLMTAGKRSPDGQFREAFYNREIAKRVVADLVDRGYDAELLVPEDDDISLAERVRRVNTACFLLGKQNVFARQQSRISLDTVSEPICQMVIWTGRKVSIS